VKNSEAGEEADIPGEEELPAPPEDSEYHPLEDHQQVEDEEEVDPTSEDFIG
jgi:hypothetical protein